jgi:hypothetical protein
VKASTAQLGRVLRELGLRRKEKSVYASEDDSLLGLDSVLKLL